MRNDVLLRSGSVGLLIGFLFDSITTYPTGFHTATAFGITIILATFLKTLRFSAFIAAFLVGEAGMLIGILSWHHVSVNIVIHTIFFDSIVLFLFYVATSKKTEYLV